MVPALESLPKLPVELLKLPSPLEDGVLAKVIPETELARSCPAASSAKACPAAVRSRLVVPLAFVEPERAEHTSARRVEGEETRYEGTISDVMARRNLPTEVPPYFWTIHVCGGGREEGAVDADAEDEADLVPVPDGADI